MSNVKKCSVKKWVPAMVILVVAVVIIAAAVYSTQSKKEIGPSVDEGTPYTTASGNTQHRLAVINIDQNYFTSQGAGPYALSEGWYLVIENISINGLTVSDDVHITIGDGLTMSVTNGITVSGGSFALYSQPVETTIGKLNSASGEAVTLVAGSTLINTASISAAGSNKSGVYGSGSGVSVINGKTGLIVGSVYGVRLNEGGTVTNSGEIRGTAISNGVGISLVKDGTVTNNKDAKIFGGQSGISMTVGGKVTNSGEIWTNATLFGYGIFANKEVGIINDGEIRSIGYAIRLMGGGTLDNSGMLKGTGTVGYGLYLDYPLTVTNRKGGTITGPTDGILITGGGTSTIYNTGDIEGQYAIYVDANTAANVTNHKEGVIQGTTYGVRLPAGGAVTNDGLIKGPTRAVYAPSNTLSLTFYNTGTIEGTVQMGDAVNYATFVAGSSISGNLTMGSNTSSTMAFIGTLDASLQYSAGGGNADIGSAAATVSLDVAGMPASLSVGDDIALINASGTMSGSPKNTTYSSGGYEFELSVISGSVLNAEVTKAPVKIYAFTLSETDYTFSEAGIGYPLQTPLTVTVTNTGNMPLSDLPVTLSGANAGGFTLSKGMINDIAVGGTETFTVVPKIGLARGTYTATVTVGQDLLAQNLIVRFTVSAEINPVYHIMATADAGSTITPSGHVEVGRGSSKSFHYAAAAGRVISAVIVDGTPVHWDEIEGDYVFRNVRANHTIEVKSAAATDILLVIHVAEGKGYAEYSVNNLPFELYDHTVVIPNHAYIMVRATAEDGYQFREWQTGTDVIKEQETSFDNVTASLYLELFFEKKSDSSNLLLWVLAAVLLLILLCFLIWFLFYRRKYHDVTVQVSSAISGESRAVRKRPYVFTVNGEYSGGVAYRAGADGEWKIVRPGADGKYTIPEKEVIDNLFLEDHP
jgi:hypothetical protein